MNCMIVPYSFPLMCSQALLWMCLHGLGQHFLIVGQHREAGDALSEAVDIGRIAKESKAQI